MRVIALLQPRREDGDPAYREGYVAENWEVPLVEIVWREV